MLKRYITLTIGLLVPLACLAADAKVPGATTPPAGPPKPLFLKTGLWETFLTTQVSRTAPIPDNQLAKLPPEEREKVEAFGKSAESGGPPHHSTFKSCLSAQDLSRPFMVGGERPGSCKRTLLASSSTKQDIHIECTKGQAKSVGDMHVQVVDPEQVKGSSLMKSTSGGVSMDVTVTFDSRWVASACK